MNWAAWGVSWLGSWGNSWGPLHEVEENPKGAAKGKGKTRKKKSFLERDGKILLFDSPAQVAQYIKAEKQAEYQLDKPEVTPKEVHRVRRVPRPTVIKYEQLKDVVVAVQGKENVPELKKDEDWDRLLEIQKKYLWLIEDDEEIELLMMGIA